MWGTYMGAPWTRDATVRAHVVTMTPEVAGRIIELRVADNQLVHKGDLLMVIDPTAFRISVSLAEAGIRKTTLEEHSFCSSTGPSSVTDLNGGSHAGSKDHP